jgi:hypothetical protein
LFQFRRLDDRHADGWKLACKAFCHSLPQRKSLIAQLGSALEQLMARGCQSLSLRFLRQLVSSGGLGVRERRLQTCALSSAAALLLRRSENVAIIGFLDRMTLCELFGERHQATLGGLRGITDSSDGDV